MKTYSLPTKLLMFSTLLATAINCGGDNSSGTNNGANTATAKGRVSDSNGSQPQSLKILSGSFGGSGSVAAASKVRVSRLKADGSLEVLADAVVKSDGRYECPVPPNEKRLIIESLDASGSVMASAIIEATSSAGQSVTVTPIDTESSVEAAVLAKMAASGVALQDCNAIDLREWITANVALAVKASSDSDVKIKALAEAVVAAQTTRVKAYAQAGITTSQSAMYDAELAASQKLDIALDSAASSASTADQAYASFHTELDASLTAIDASAKKHARAIQEASVAFRATLKARLSSASDAVFDASVRAAASAEARLSAEAVVAIMAAGSASSSSSSAATTASSSLRTQLSASASAAASVTAFTAWNTAITGGSAVTGSVLGTYLAVDATSAIAVQAALTVTATATTALDAALKVSASSLSATGSNDYNVLAQSIISAYTAYDSAINAQAQLTALVSFGAKAQTALDIMTVVNGCYRNQ